MNRNTEAHFSKLPSVRIQRSLFDRSCQNKLSFNAGLLIPIFADEYLPGDTFTMDTSIVIRTSSAMIKPVMDNMYADIYYFSVPNRLVWEHWKEFMGENNSGPWARTTEYTIPQVTAPSGGWDKGTLADYFGIPTKISNLSISALFFRAYGLIWNEYFRDENLMNLTNVPKTDATVAGTNGGTLELDPCKGGLPLPVCKFHDQFTSCLPSAQKGNPIYIPIASGTIPVYGNGNALLLTNNGSSSSTVGNAFWLLRTQDSQATNLYSNVAYAPWTSTNITQNSSIGNSPNSNSVIIDYRGDISGDTSQKLGVPTKDKLVNTYGTGGGPPLSGLVADVGTIAGPNVNDLRECVALQRLLEKDARGGTRYIEMIKAHFNVNSPDARLQRPEYLGGKRIPINVSQVVQMSGTESASGTQQTPQANVAAYSLTTDKSGSFTKSFTEHGMIIGLMCVRTEHTYQQGINRMFSRSRRYDFYFPSLANLGEEPVKVKEIYATGTSSTDNAAFGFQERWFDYRYKPSMVCGQMRSNATGTLDVYHFADNYASKPTLGQTWIQEVKTNIDRTLAVPSTTTDQFIADIYFSYRCARPMPAYSVPGLMDHF